MKERRPQHDPVSRPYKKRDLTISFSEMLQLLFEQRVTGKVTLVLRHGRPVVMLRGQQTTYFSE